MAQGDLTRIPTFLEELGKGTHDLDLAGYECILVSDTYAVASAATGTSTLTEVTGTGYAAVSLTVALSQVNNGIRWDSTVNPSWTKNASGPTDIRTAVIQDTNAATTVDITHVVDMTADGSTPISLQDGDISITFDANGITEIGT